jgi:3-methyl-2-oxobutanoate hydroxymethyltransferase
MKTISDFRKKKINNEKFTIVTCYDYWSAKIIDESDVDAVLVGDSVAMVMHGFETTINADVEMMMFHTAAVKRGLQNKFLVTDIPFLAHRKGREYLVNASERLLKAGAQAVKIEGADGNLENIEFLVKSGVPVMGHLGLTPQSVHQFSGFKLQGKTEEKAEKIIADAIALQDAGCFSLVLEMVPAMLAEEITNKLEIPTIGIGAGNKTDAQILVLQDLLGASKTFSPKFLRRYENQYYSVLKALNQYTKDVKEIKFPTEKESY